MLLQWDTTLFYAINHGLANPLFDTLMPFITAVKNWYVVYVLGLGFMLWKGSAQQRLGVVALLIGVAISDPLNSRVIKEVFDRERPCVALADARLCIGKPGGHSFPSSHATNNFLAAIILSACYSRKWWLWFSIALVVGFSRIYVGAHYPLDIVGGAIVGMIVGTMIWKSLLWAYNLYQNKKRPQTL